MPKAITATAHKLACIIYNMITLGIARASGVHTIHGAAGGLLALGAWIFAMVAVLGTEDYLTKRYGFGVASGLGFDFVPTVLMAITR